MPDEIFELQILPDNNYGFRVLAGDINSQGRLADRDWLEGKLRGKKAQFDKAGTPVEYRRGPPVLGEHTVEVLRGLLGRSESEIARLRTAGVI